MTSTEAKSIGQASLHARPEPQVADTARDGRRIVCPDCGEPVGPTRGGHELPDGRRVHGWACNACENVFPAGCGGPEARTWNHRIVGLEVEFRDGTTRWVAAFADGGER